MQLHSGTEIKDNTVDTAYNRNPMIVGLADGGYAMAWNSTDGAIYTRAYEANDVAYGDHEISAITTSGGNGYEYLSGIVALAGGGYQLAWTSFGGDGYGYGILQQSFDSHGAMTGSESILNSETIPGPSRNDKLKGLGGADTFTFRTGDDKDTIVDFTAKGAYHDILDITSLTSVASYKDLMAHHVTQLSKGVLIDGLDGDTIMLTGVKFGDLDKADFHI